MPSSIGVVRSVGVIDNLRDILKIGLVTIILVLIFTSAVIQSIQQKSLTPMSEQLGRQFLLSTLNLEEASLQIIENKGIYNPEGSKFSNLWEIIANLSEFLVSFSIIYIWIKFLVFVFKKTPISDETNQFKNFVLAFATFTFLQIIFVVSHAAIYNQINSPSDVAYLMIVPFKAYYTFVISIPYIISPIASKVGDYTKYIGLNLTNGTG